MKFKIACGTDNGKTFTDGHFGDSKYFLIYEYNTENHSFGFIQKVKNIFKEEQKHDDAQKAKSISDILQDIQVVLAFAMGPNITKIRKKFIPVISREKDIIKSFDNIKKEIAEMINEMELPSGKDKKIFII